MQKPKALSFLDVLTDLSGAFTRPSFVTFTHLMMGWLLCHHHHCTTDLIKAAGLEGVKHHTTFERFFSRARWAQSAVWALLIQLVVRHFKLGTTLTLAVDDTLCHHKGPKIFARGLHVDPVRSMPHRKIIQAGHVWVVLTLVVMLKDGRHVTLPIEARLFIPRKWCKKGDKHLTKPQLARQMVDDVHRTLPHHKLRVLGDSAYVRSALLLDPVENTECLGRTRTNLAINALPPRKKVRGRPRVKGDRIDSPDEWAARRGGWQKIDVDMHGRRQSLEFKRRDVLWYKAAGPRCLRMLVVRGWPGKKNVTFSLLSTDLTMSAEDIIALYSLRWGIEVMFHEVKENLGFEDPQNRTPAAVQRTALMALWAFTLIHVWDVATGATDVPKSWPWYQKILTSFADRLAAARRSLWMQRLLASKRVDRTNEKPNEFLVERLSEGS